jgi:hypothetical protein
LENITSIGEPKNIIGYKYESGLTVNVKKTKVMVFNFVDPCQEFAFEGDAIEHV